MRFDTRKNRTLMTNQIPMRHFAAQRNFLGVEDPADLLLKILHFVGEELDDEQEIRLVLQVGKQFVVKDFGVVAILANHA